MLSPPLLASLRSLLARLIPAEADWPGALESGVENYLIRQMAGDCAGEAPRWRLGLLQLDAEAAARFQKNFVALQPAQQDTLIGELEQGRTATEWPAEISAAAWIDRMIQLTHEGFYADCSNGGNRDAVSWRMVRFDSRMPQGDQSTAP